MGILGWLKGGSGFPEFTPRDSEDSFREFVEAEGLQTNALTAPQAVELMLRHYATFRAKGCSAQDGDMLLYQWGTYDWGAGSHFEFDLTRQFTIEDAEGDDGISQLSLTLQFPASDSLAGLESGNLWCHSPEELEGFRALVLGGDVYKALEQQPAAVAAVGWGSV